MDKKDKLLIIDSNSLIHRGYHALPPLKTSEGEIVNAIYGFFLIFLKAIKKFEPEYVTAAFDHPAPSFRKELYEEYKANRPETPQDLIDQIKKTKEVLNSFNVPVFEKEGFEADDIIGTVSSKVKDEDLETIIISGDRDLFQLIDEDTFVWTTQKGIKDTVLFDKEKFEKKYNINLSQFVDYKALKGDSSDNIPGISGIGKKRAASLLGNFENLEEIYKKVFNSKEVSDSIKNKLKENKEEAFLSKKLAKIKRDIPFDFKLSNCKFDDFEKREVVDKFKKLEFKSLIKKIPGIKEKDIDQQKGIEQKIEKLYDKGVFSEKIYKIEKNLVSVVEKMEKNGIKLDLEKLEKLSKKIKNLLQKTDEKIYKKAGEEFNVNSPQQVSKILFDKLDIPTDEIKKTPAGSISTAASELEKIKDNHPIAGLILKHRELSKLESGFIKALPKLVEEDGRIHPNFHQLGTETGRMSCSDPNLQNIPKRTELGRKIRKSFIPQEGFEFVSFDYSQIEMRLAASLSGDKKMIRFFKEGKDFHTSTAAQIFETEEEKVTKKQRGIAKTLNFGMMYGLGPYSFSQRADISFKKAKEFINKYFEKFSTLKKYREKLIEEAKEKKYAKTLWGRKRFLPGIKSKNGRIKSQAERMALNMPIQGTQADIIKKAMVEIDDNNLLFSDCRLLLQIHDELLFEIKKGKSEQIEQIKGIMEDVIDLEVKAKVDILEGENWGDIN